MFRPPPKPPLASSPAPGYAGGRPLHARIVETLRYFSDEIDSRRAGGLGEAQAAGYIAGRLRRADYAAAVQSFTAGVSEKLPLALCTLLGAAGGSIAILARNTRLGPFWGGLALLLLAAALGLLLAEVDVLPIGTTTLRRLVKGKTSQSVIAGRAAKGKKTKWRVLVVAPLDGPLRSVLHRQGLLVLFGVLVLETVAVVALLFTAAPWLHGLAAVCAVGVGLLGVWIVLRLWDRTPLPAIYGAGELTTLMMVAEELEALHAVEVWIVALGGSTIGTENIRALFAQYPFSAADTCIINLHAINGGQPVFVTREGLLRERRSDRMLLAAAADADAADIMIDAEPRRIRERTLAQALAHRRLRTITISSHSDVSPFATPEPATIERCVRLVVGMIRGLDL